MTALRTLQAAFAIAGACLAASAAVGQEAAKWIGFSDKAEVRLPSHFRVESRDGNVLNVVSGGAAAVRFSLELQVAGGATVPRRSGEELVRELAKKKDLKLHQSGNKLVLIEPRTKGMLDGRDVRIMQLHIGFGRSVVAMTLTVFEDGKDSVLARRFFDADMEQMIRSIRRTDA